eukprot:gene6070-4240_t
MDGRARTSRSMAVLYDGEKVFTDTRDIADLLVRRYAEVSRLDSTDPAAERRLRAEIEHRLGLGRPTPSTKRPIPRGLLEDMKEVCTPFVPGELQTALRSLKRRKAAGPDGIANEMLLHLGEQGKEVLLRLANASWGTATVPAAWRVAEIIPILKKDKDPHEG